MTAEHDVQKGVSTDSDPDDLDDYEFELGASFVRWVPWGDEREDDDVWQVTNRYWQEKVSWVPDRDNVPTRDAHRVYELLSRETFDTVMVSEEDLTRGDWQAWDYEREVPLGR